MSLLPHWRLRCIRHACAAAVLSLLAVAASAAAPTEIRTLGESARGAPDATFAALQALRARPAASAAERLEVLTVLGLTLGDARRAEAAGAVVKELEAWAAQRPDAAVQAAALAVAANVERQSGDLAHAEASLVEALRISPAAPASIERFRLLHMLARVRIETGALDGGLQAAQETVRIAQALEAEPDGALLRARALHQLAYVLTRAKQPERARDTVAEALRWVERSGNRAEASRVRGMEGIVMSELQREADSVAAYRAALALAREAGWATQEVLMLGNLADSLLRMSAYEPARAAAQEALDKSRVNGDSLAESLALTNLGLAELGLRRLDAGRQHIEQALAIERKKGARAEEEGILIDASAAYERAGDYPEAIAAYQQLRELQDRLQQRNHLRAVLDLQERYEREQRARTMGSMAERAQLQDAALRSQTLRQRAWGLATAAGVLLLALVALLLRQHQSGNREMASTNEQLRVLSGRDPLTGLANRRQVRGVLESADAPFTGTLLLIDLDHFKCVNDSAGHAAGDAVLVEVARRLREVLRGADLLARWGGEEFLIAVRALPAEQIEPMVLRLLDAIGDSPVATKAGPQAVTASIGYASLPLAPQGLVLPWERAVGLVDAALFLAKRHGRNRACGIHLLRARGEAEVAAIERGLEGAAQRGDVTLDWLEGPPQEVAEPAARGMAGLPA